MNLPEQEITIDEIVESFSARLEAGERPAIEEYRQRYPHLANRIDAVLPALVALENVDSHPQPNRLAVDDSIPEKLGDYQILQEIGRGGMGIVFEALHTKMRRHVALKVLPKSLVDRANYLDRFLAEARSAGKLHHTNIVPVFEVGESNGIHFYSMQFIHGESLDLVIRDIRLLQKTGATDDAPVANDNDEFADGPKHQGQETISRSIALSLTVKPSDSRPLPAAEAETRDKRDVAVGQTSVADPGLSSAASGALRSRQTYHRRVAAIGVQIARALDYAHCSGVLHRDVKPANLILDTAGNIWVTDFGLAKTDQHDLTQTGDIVGTLQYMSPERFAGKADPRSDIYGLGLTLYEMCTLQPAFDSDRAATIRDESNSGVVSPRKIDESIPADLETIILKSLEPRPQHRYQSASDLATDLQLFLDDRPIYARRMGAIERVWKLCRRNPIAASLAAASLLMLMTIAIGSTMAAIRIYRQTQQLVRQNERAESHLALTQKSLDDMLYRVVHELRNVPRMDGLREQILSDAVDAQQQFLNLEPNKEEITSKAVNAYLRKAELQSQMGQFEQSLTTLDHVIKLLETVPDATQWKAVTLGRALILSASALRLQGKSEAAQHAIESAITELKNSRPLDANGSIHLANAYRQFSVLLEKRGRVKAAIDSLEQALGILDETDQCDCMQQDERMNVIAEVLNSLAISYRASGELDQAEEMYRRVIELCGPIQDVEFRNVGAMDTLGTTALNFGNLHMLRKRYREAENVYGLAAQIFE